MVGPIDYHPIPIALEDMFIELVEARAINLPSPRLEMLNCDKSRYCPYHKRNGHNLKDY